MEQSKSQAKNKIYVGNLPFKLSEDELEQFFATAGSVLSVKIITDNITGRSKGFAFVEMQTDKDAQNAIEKLNGKELKGRPLRVAPALAPKVRNR